jgi:hypothetical protein
MIAYKSGPKPTFQNLFSKSIKSIGELSNQCSNKDHKITFGLDNTTYVICHKKNMVFKKFNMVMSFS